MTDEGVYREIQSLSFNLNSFKDLLQGSTYLQLTWLQVPFTNFIKHAGRGCDTVGSVVAADTRGPWFESTHRQLSMNNYFL